MPTTRWVLAIAGLWLGLCDSGKAGDLVAPEAAPTIFTAEIPRTENSLPQSSVIAMTQTPDGYLWLGTLNGLVRFDGVRYTVFDEYNTPGLNSSRIVHLFADSRGDLWAGTETAGVVLIKKNGEVRNLDFARGGREQRLASACEDSTGAVWLYAADGQLGCVRKGSVDVWRFGAQYASNCRLVAAEKSGQLWVGVDWGLYSMNAAAALEPRSLPPLGYVLPARKLDYVVASASGGYWRLADGRVQKWRANQVERDLGLYPWTSRAHVSAACEDREGNLFVGTITDTGGEGVFWFGADGKTARITSDQGLSHSGILSLCVDQERNLWVGTDGGGVNRVKRRVFEVAEPARGKVVQTVSADATGGLWMGFNGGGATYWKGATFTNYGASEGLLSFNMPALSMSAIFVDGDGGVWAGTRGGGLFRFQTNRFAPAPRMEKISRDILAIHQDRQGRLWIGTGAGLARWDGRDWEMRRDLSAVAVRAIADDRAGNLWIGTAGDGLKRLHGEQFTPIHVKDGLPSEDISALLADNADVLWVGTRGNGLARFADGKWTRYTTREGLVANSISFLIEDDAGELWIGSNAGLMRVPKKSLNDFANGVTNTIACRVYAEADGLPTKECTQGSQPAACRTRDGVLWFPTIRGLVSVNPAQLSRNTNPPPVMIEAVLVDDELQNTNRFRSNWPEQLTIPAGRERLEIRYTSLNLGAPDRARFKYQMEGYEKAETDAGVTRVEHFSNLPPGTYHFRVKASNEDGVWNNAGAVLAIVVEPPFWRTWWFLTLSTAGLLGLIVATVHFISTQKLQRQLAAMRQHEALEKERARIARDLHDQLGANLTQVSLLGEMVETDKDLPEEVEAHAKQISQTARTTAAALDEIVWAANPSNDTLDGLVTYACKYAQEYLALAGLSYRLDVPEQLPSTPVAPDVRHNVFLAFKEAVNNVVKHAGAKSVRVRLALDSNQFTIEIEDDGRGVSEADQAKGRNGLRNMRKRMEDLGGEFSVAPAAERGTRVRLTAPIKKN